MKVKIVSRDPFYLAGAVKTHDTGYKKYKMHKKVQKKVHTDEPYKWEIPDMETTFNRFGEMMTNFGKHIEKNAKKWDGDIKDFGDKAHEHADDFGKKMDTWGKDFGRKMDTWGKDFGARMEAFGESEEARWNGVWEANEAEEEAINEWSMRYPVYQTYKAIYEGELKDNDDLIDDGVFYEVQIMEIKKPAVLPQMFIGSRFESLRGVTYPAVSMTFDPEKWLVIKLTKEEYDKDWLAKLRTLELIEDYELEPYFIVKHYFEKSEDLIKVFCPLKGQSI